MTRRLALVSVLAVLVTVATGALVISRSDEADPVRNRPQPDAELALLVVTTETEPLAAVVGGTGFGQVGAIVVPPRAAVTIPGQGEATVGEALDLPPDQASIAAGNLLGVWVEHHAVIEDRTLASLADEVGGVEVGDQTLGGAEVLALLAEPEPGGVAGLQLVLEALLAADVGWAAADFTETDHEPAVTRALDSAAGSRAVVLEVDEVASDVFVASPDQVVRALVDAFGGPAEAAIPVIVLNGNGVPGIGELVAERILPAGFRVAISENASTFDHRETLVVVGSSDDVALAERVRDLLGVGSVSVSVGSGIAPVTVVIGKDFTG
ncbi:MAG: LytR C-terminal domain-containing protein [Actinobacteria bacterium]|nr:LytR C-terminal domain-containing protein [Actinomycetota bacterium]